MHLDSFETNSHAMLNIPVCGKPISNTVRHMYDMHNALLSLWHERNAGSAKEHGICITTKITLDESLEDDGGMTYEKWPATSVSRTSNRRHLAIGLLAFASLHCRYICLITIRFMNFRSSRYLLWI